MTHGRTAAAPTVADAMLRRPTIHPADLTVAQARAAFDASPKTHLLVLAHGRRLVGAVTREDLAQDARARSAAPTEPVARLGTLAGRTVAPGVPLDRVRAEMIAQGRRRLVVVDPELRILGLLCLKRSRSGFCCDAGVASMRTTRRGAVLAHIVSSR